MTAARPRRSVSPCQSATGSAPARVTARAASASSSDPGKVMTPTRAVMSILAAGRARVVLPAGYRAAVSGESARVPQLAFQPERVVPPRHPLLQRDDGAQSGPAAQRHIVHAGPHDGQAAAGLRQHGDHLVLGEWLPGRAPPPAGPRGPAGRGAGSPGG